MAVHLKIFILASGMLLVSCSHGPCGTLGSLFGCNRARKIADPQDPSIQFPVFDSTSHMEADLDGYVFQAIRIAANDYLSPDPAEPSCDRNQSSYGYRASRKGDIVFVRIDFKPENCGGNIDMLDGGASYAISVDGRILRRSLDGFGP
jgi:hypothetical protein